MSRLLRTLALPIGLLLAGAATPAADRIVFHSAYGDARGILIEGRVLAGHAEQQADPADSHWRNLRRNVRHFADDEGKHRALTLHLGDKHWPARSDDEGYFRLAAEIALPPGWHPLRGESGKAAGNGMLLVVPAENTRGLISDLDDTVIVTEVNDKRRMLANTFLKNPTQRLAVPGVAGLYARVAATNPQAAAAPFFYLSASPRQLHEAIAGFLEHNGFPHGALITKRVSKDRQSDPWLDQFAYKVGKIEEILERLPQVRFILVGDDGEKDPEIYDAIRQRHPDRVEAIWIHRVNPDPARPRPDDQRDLTEIIAEGAAR